MHHPSNTSAAIEVKPRFERDSRLYPCLSFRQGSNHLGVDMADTLTFAIASSGLSIPLGRHNLVE